MDHGPFIAGAYLVAVVAIGGLTLASFLRMRRAERED
ncbi:MAG: heme exporter protein CcmD [Sphingomonadaceae bacterium]|nr:heme exporter protein CcmD [Thermaurantiacus sp.]MCS6986487.1 heme exporter protein CcmD [Sphingomonadaceae bacterium]MDW8414252.1 heme exporter protein CcmD [Thermaurantiacus sp.]